MWWQPWRSVIWYVHPLSTPWFQHILGCNYSFHYKTMTWVWALSPSIWTILFMQNPYRPLPHTPIYGMISKPPDNILLHKWKSILNYQYQRLQKNTMKSDMKGVTMRDQKLPKRSLDICTPYVSLILWVCTNVWKG